MGDPPIGRGPESSEAPSIAAHSKDPPAVGEKATEILYVHCRMLVTPVFHDKQTVKIFIRRLKKDSRPLSRTTSSLARRAVDQALQGLVCVI